jgi:hypothetical protein
MQITNHIAISGITRPTHSRYGLPLSVVRLFAKEAVNCVEHLPSILFHEDRMGALADSDPPAVRRRPEHAEHGLRHVDDMAGR